MGCCRARGFGVAEEIDHLLIERIRRNTFDQFADLRPFLIGQNIGARLDEIVMPFDAVDLEFDVDAFVQRGAETKLATARSHVVAGTIAGWELLDDVLEPPESRRIEIGAVRVELAGARKASSLTGLSQPCS
jgi:hypothetical protein